ncbi:MAG: tetratricopeptide repeat-containing protein [Balneola sp.]|nr:MAG: tetratricopeptide repeat-containing protein [Balneola sp.]
MQTLPFNIPKSLSSYVEKFETDPEGSTKKLAKLIHKRDPDAVGHFLLAWFYHLQGQNQLAIKEALIAKTYAPGSPLMEHLHYFLIHPELFEARVPSTNYSSQRKLQQASRTSPILDLDRLIELLEEVESQRIQIPLGNEDANDEDLSEDSSDVGDIVSETLAKIHEKQGNRSEAIKMYERLITLNEDKAEIYSSQISKLQED